MLTQRDKILIGTAALSLVVLAVTFSGEPQYRICDYPNDQETICDQYHVLPYLFVELVRGSDAHIGFISLVTGILVALFTLGLVLLGRKADSHFRVVERAYVKMSHYPPGIDWFETTAMAHATIAIRVKNFGRTPGHVTDVHVEGRLLQEGEELPAIPQYELLEGREITSAFLVTDDEFVHRVDLGIPPRDLQKIREGAARYFIIGYVDYRDRFGGHHRGCFGRFYDPDIDDTAQLGSGNVWTEEVWTGRNNLTIIEQPLYNDDRERVRGEGNDWD
jgi:hypothetical protein